MKRILKKLLIIITFKGCRSKCVLEQIEKRKNKNNKNNDNNNNNINI